MKTFRDHYIRHRSTRLSSIPTKRMMNSSVEQCAEHCIKETVFYCKSFDVDNARRHCLLFMVDDQDRDVSVIEDPNVDHYEGKGCWLECVHHSGQLCSLYAEYPQPRCMCPCVWVMRLVCELAELSRYIN